ncbi:MAG: methyl-accepting chemotaxis protein [Desulfobacteraceae bacterium]|nr:methyl-accepting chemotaxis protein [Desulfobacteraceae bacterium]
MAEESAKPYRRRIVYIHREYQRSFIVRFSLVAVAAMTIASILLYVLSRESITATYQFHHLALRSTAEAILRPLLITNAVVLACFVLATVFVTVYVSHKVGGPLWHFGRSLKSIGEGDLQVQIRLRKKDQLKDFADQINEMTRNLNAKASEVQNQVTKLRMKAQTLDVQMPGLKEDIEKLHLSVFELFKTK